jgi:DNA-binding MarR family transcriptional regulator/N-acetylglutamate synthase-like GNAT family acetyltransferase
LASTTFFAFAAGRSMTRSQISDAEQRVSDVRRFNRFYTQKIGVLQEGLLDSAYSLAEVRVLYELAHWRDEADRETTPLSPSASRLAVRLGLDEGYLSRLLRGFEKQRLIVRKPSPDDGREHIVSLTPRGRKAFAPLELRSQQQVAAMLAPLSGLERSRLAAAMTTIEQVLGPRPGKPGTTAFTLRSLRPGDIGWVTHRHGVLYAEEYGYDERFEALVAEIAGHFVQAFDVQRERCWIAERGGERLGCVFLVSKSPTVAKLRLLLVEPDARGLGLGARLVDECIAFARQAGYRKMVLWTQSELLAARRIYEQRGFRRVDEEPHRSFGRDLVAETWELRLSRKTARNDRIQTRARE